MIFDKELNVIFLTFISYPIFTLGMDMKSLFSQYKGFIAGTVMATGYALVRKPSNGVGIMLIAATAGTFADWTYGWNVGCRSEVLTWQRYSRQLAESKTGNSEKLQDVSNSLEINDSSFQNDNTEYFTKDDNDPKR